jgi:negative regulator of flagellin synthesis FlgM
MKINQYSNQINRVGAVQAYQKASEQPKKQQSQTRAQYDQVEISSQAQQQIQKDKDAKIEQLKNQIANGTYKVDSEKIAEKLLAFYKTGSKIDE